MNRHIFVWLRLAATSVVLTAAPELLSHSRAIAAVDDWALCMTASTPARVVVSRCGQVLLRHDMSAFQRSLLLGAEGDGFHHLHEERRAVLAYTQALSLTPDDEVNLSSRGQAEEASGRLGDAKRDYDAAIARHLGDAANRSNGSAAILANEYAMRGRDLLNLGNATGALKDLQEAISLYPLGSTVELKRLVVKARRQVRR